MIRTSRRAMRPRFDSLDDRCLLSGLTPQQVQAAYGLSGIKFSSGGQTVAGDGSGQTIAVVVAYHDPNLASDLKTFDAALGLPDPTLNVVDQAGAATNDGWAGEETLDVEWAHAMAPGANIIVVEARTDGLQDMMNAVDAARNIPGVAVVSTSWGMSESPTEIQYDSNFTTPAGHTGITFIAASGDSGPWAGAQWPSSSPNVVSVGGTSLFADASGSYLGEWPWMGSGGGFSNFEPEPGFQAGVQGSGARTTPDVAFNADPSTGVAVYETVPSTGQGSWQVIGGTSLGAPAWAGIMAIVDQGRAVAGLGTLNGATQTLPALYSIPAGDFHQVSALTTTGLGTPNGAALVSDLAFSVANAGAKAVSVSGGDTPAAIATTPGNSTTATAPPTATPTRKHHRHVVRVRRARHATRAVAAATSRPVQPVAAVDAAIRELMATARN